MTAIGNVHLRGAPSDSAPLALHSNRRRFQSLALATKARPLRFAVVGGLCGLLQLVLLVALKRLAIEPIGANVGAYLCSAQVNFVLSNRFIWHDRWSTHAGGRELLRRWLSFHGSIAGTFLVSQVVFIVARTTIPDVIASALGLGIAALANFLIQDRLTFSQVEREPGRPERPQTE